MSRDVSDTGATMDEQEPPWKNVIDAMVRIVNPRLANSTFHNYKVVEDRSYPLRKEAYDAALLYAEQLRENPKSGKNLILIGSPGTGKDHLAVAVMVAVFGYLPSLKYIRGSTLSNVCREHAVEHYTDVPGHIMQADLLVISDIEPSASKLSDFEYRALMSLIDHRYVHFLPTIVTSNVQSVPHLKQLIGNMAVDRLCHNSVVVPMVWSSYREEQKG